MTTSTAEFFDALVHRGHEPLLERVDATVRFDITDDGRTEHRLVRIAHGDITVTADDGPADCTIGGDRAVMDAIVSGRTSVLAALLRGGLAVDGNFELMVLSRRLTPRPPPTTASRDAVAGQGRSS